MPKSKRPGNGKLPGVNNTHNVRWFRLENESWQAYESFAIFRDIGKGRSLGKAAEAVGKSLGQMKHWSAKHDWFDRAQSFDANEEFERMVSMRDRRQEWIIADLDATAKMQDKIRRRLEQLDPETLTPHQLIRWYDVISRRQEKILGITPEQMEEQLASEASEVSELERLMDESPEVRNAVLDHLQRERDLTDIG